MIQCAVQPKGIVWLDCSVLPCIARFSWFRLVLLVRLVRWSVWFVGLFGFVGFVRSVWFGGNLEYRVGGGVC